MFDYCFELLQILEFLDDMECPLQALPFFLLMISIALNTWYRYIPVYTVPVVERAVHCSDMPCNQVFLNVKISVGVLWISWYSVPPNTHSEGTDYVRSNNLHVYTLHIFWGSNHLQYRY